MQTAGHEVPRLPQTSQSLPEEQREQREDDEQREHRINHDGRFFRPGTYRLRLRLFNRRAAAEADERLCRQFRSGTHDISSAPEYGTILRMIPLRDVIPSRTFPLFTIIFIVLNCVAFLFELSLGEKGLEPFCTDGRWSRRSSRGSPC